MATNGSADAVSKYETEEGLKEVAAFLRGRNGMPLRPAIEVDKRVEYFKGELLLIWDGTMWVGERMFIVVLCCVVLFPLERMKESNQGHPFSACLALGPLDHNHAKARTECSCCTAVPCLAVHNAFAWRTAVGGKEGTAV